jgi:hypothetical protein
MLCKMLRLILAMGMLTAGAYAEQTVEGHVVNSVGVRLLPAGAIAETSLYSGTTDLSVVSGSEGVKDGAYALLDTVLELAAT